MSRKNVSFNILLVLVCWAALIVPAFAQHFQQVKGTLSQVAAGRNEVFGIDSSFPRLAIQSHDAILRQNSRGVARPHCSRRRHSLPA
jgi:hypothetical protein